MHLGKILASRLLKQMDAFRSTEAMATGSDLVEATLLQQAGFLF